MGTTSDKPVRQTPKGNAIYRGWTSDRKYREACRLHLVEGWSQNKSAAELGISRSRFTQWLKNPELFALRDHIVTDAKNAKLAEEVGAAALSPLGLMEERRVGTIHEFVERYFGEEVCEEHYTKHALPPHHTEMLTAFQDPDSYRVLVNLPPGHGKTNVAVKDAIYDLVKNPNHRSMFVSQSQDYSKTIMRQLKSWLTDEDLYRNGPNLIKDWGPFRADGIKWTEQQVLVPRTSSAKEPTVAALGYGNQIYGRRSDKIYLDDLANTENSRNPDQVIKMQEWITKMVISRLGETGKLVLIGTRVGVGDIYESFGKLPAFKVLRYPWVIDEVLGTTLWPEHRSYDFAQRIRWGDEIREDYWQLVYQQVAMPGASASFTVEAVNNCKNTNRTIGQFDPKWRLIAGLDPGGAGVKAGFTAGVLLGVDRETGKRYLIDIFNERGLRAPQLKEKIFEWSEQYPIYAWRVERNAIQSQLVQYNTDITSHLATLGTRVDGHTTNSNKWDADFGVESMAALFNAGMIDIPWNGARTAQKLQPWIDQLITFPMNAVSDLVMASWFAELGCRQFVQRSHMPLFSNRQRAGRRGRVVVDFATQEIQQIGGFLTPQAADDPLSNRYQRLLSGRVGGNRRPMQVLRDPRERRDLDDQGYVNVERSHISDEADPDKE